MTSTTASEEKAPTGTRPATAGSRLALVLAWAKGRDERVGELLWIAPGDRRTHVFGRGAEPPRNPSWTRVMLVRQRPGGTAAAAPLDVSTLSREQLRFQAIDDDTLAIENIGKRALFVGGERTTQAVLRPGVALRVDGVLVALCIKRPELVPPLAHLSLAALPAPGAPDADGIVGESPATWALRDGLAFVREQRGHVLVHGLPGSGTGLVARAIAGPEALELSIAELAPDELLSGLVHHAREGRSALVVSGLEASPEAAALLARVLDDEEVVVRGQRLRLRIVARARDAADLPGSSAGAFRHVLAVPALAERREDIPFILQRLADLALHDNPSLAARFADASGRARLSAELVEHALALPLDGGARELVQCLWRALRASAGEVIDAPPAEPGGARPLARGPEPEPVAVEGEEAPEASSELVSRLAGLTRTERAIMQHLGLSRTSQQIARALFVSVRTVQNHRARICRKLELSGHHSLLAVALAVKGALGPPPGG